MPSKNCISIIVFLLGYTAVATIHYGIWTAYTNNHYRWQGNLFEEDCIGYPSTNEGCVIDYTCGASHLNPPAKYYADLSQEECETTIYPSLTNRYVDKSDLSTHGRTNFQFIEFLGWLGVIIFSIFSIIAPFLIISDITAGNCGSCKSCKNCERFDKFFPCNMLPTLPATVQLPRPTASHPTTTPTTPTPETIQVTDDGTVSLIFE